MIVFELQDLKSLNGTFVNDVRVTRKELCHGDEIVFSGGNAVRKGKKKRQKTNLRYKISIKD